MTWRRSSGRVLVPTYVESGALDRPCPHCGAGVAQWCQTPNGHDRRIPCVDRTRPPATTATTAEGVPCD